LLQYAILTQLGPWISDSVRLKRDEIGMNRHRALGCCCLSMIFSENRSTPFRIMPWGGGSSVRPTKAQWCR
ncbi:hypothetical protein, partial [Bradyrhizobium sp. UFLA05-112]